MSKGLFITLEGNEGCGKSTQIRLLAAALKKEGKKVFVTREPGGTRTSDGIRRVLLDAKNKKISAVTETLLYMASRAQLVREVIEPKLHAGNIVLCDRWLDATVAYQGVAGGVDMRWIRSLGEVATKGIHPKRTLFLDLPLEAGLKRATRRKKADRIERKALAFHRKVREGYQKIAKLEPRRFRVVAVLEEDSPAVVHRKIRKALRDLV